MRRWLDENFPYKFDYSGFGLASIIRNDTLLHIRLHAVRPVSERERYIRDLYIAWCDNKHFVLMGYEIKLNNVYLDISDPQFFEKLKTTLSEYLIGFEKAGYVLPRRNSYTVGY